MDTKELLLELVNMIKELSPEVWKVYLLQVKVLLIRQYIVSGFSLLLTLFCGFSIKPLYKLGLEDRDWDEVYMFPVVVGTITTVIMIASIMAIIGYTINPAYRAINLLLDIVR